MKRLLIIIIIVLLGSILIVALYPSIQSFITLWFSKFAIWFYPDNPNRNADFLKIILSVLAGVGVFFGIYVSLWRAKTTEESVKLQAEAIKKQGQQIQLAVKSQIDERFSNAIEHLGSDKEPVLLGGIAELHQTAKESSKDYAEVAFNILCSYIRSNTNIYKKNADDFNATAIQTIINYLFKPSSGNENPYKNLKTDLSHSNLLGVDLNDCDFTGADFSFSLMPSMENVMLDYANIGSADFSVATLKNVSLKKARVFNARFILSRLTDVSFEECSDGGVIFIDSDLTNVSFANTSIYKSLFLSCLLDRVNFENVNFTTTSFACSLIRNTDFTNLPMMFELDFRATAFSKSIFKSFMSKCKFNGCDNSYSSHRYFFEERLSSQLGKKADVSNINFNKTLFSDSNIGELSNADVEELRDLYLKQKEKRLKRS